MLRWPADEVSQSMNFMPSSRFTVGYLAGSDQDEVVVHDLAPVDAEAGLDEFQLGRGVMDEHDVAIAALADLQRLPGAERDDADLDAGRRGEGRQQMAEQAGLLGRGRRC